MNERKFLFVTCVNDEAMYARCLKHLDQLTVPDGYALERLPIRRAASMAAGYNAALANDAKYKIYLHQDVFVLRPSFLHDLLTLFQGNEALGLLGMVGCKQLPPNGMWWAGNDLFGKVIGYQRDTYYHHKFREVRGSWESVAAVDGLLMATQYDVPWRDDIFTGFHFYDVSQAQEFINRGFAVGVPQQRDPWCLHYHKNHQLDHVYHQYRQLFIEHYRS
ncbi:glycosyltransferase family protein [Numidum massiliense]|uniref:glycosyltransferase family protein n=1 Tax=Numidum massiliense TaxID=1522315 RepID=UPI0009405AF5|nr:glycosyltransferase family protein [Numidum massiliense]